jgi:NADPH-dependent 2,4-dienoyl-CoA reductase/sulfur reductase-like enzyme
VLLNTGAEKIDVKEKEVLTVVSKKLSYDKFLIATVGSPVVPRLKV